MMKINAILTALLTFTFVISPALTDPFTGFRADQLPIPQIDPPVQPAGYAFAIWGLIYGWLIISAVYGLWKRRVDRDWNKARPALIISLTVGTPWLAIAHQSAIWATIGIFIMAGTAIAALMRAPATDKWWLQTPVALYAGWLTAAAFVSLGTTAAGYDVLFGPLGWAYVSIIAALTLAIAVIYRTGNRAYGLTVIWALVGIIAANGMDTITVSMLAGIGIIVLLAFLTPADLIGRQDLS